MSLHGLLSVTIGVPNVAETAAYYADFGLAPRSGQLVQHHRRRPPAADRARAHPAAGGAAGRRRRRRRPGPRRGRLAPARRARSTSARRRWTPLEPVTGMRVVPGGRAPAAPGRGRRPPPTTARAAPSGQDRRAPGFARTSARPPAQARPRRDGQHRLRGQHDVLHRRPRLQGQRPDQGRRRVHALLDRPSQRAGAGRPGELPAPHLLAGRRHRRGRPRRATRCSRATPSGTCGASAGTTPARTSSGT